MNWRNNIAGIAITVLGFSVPNCASSASPNCFGPNEKAPFPIIQNAPPPREGAADYPYYPVDIAATAQIEPLTQTGRQRVKGAFWLWANHGPRSQDGGEKGNITPGSPGVQIRFSSSAAADACTMARTATLIGQSPSAYLERARLTPAEGAQQQDTLDVCVLPEKALPQGDSIVLDYEVQDGRTASETLAFLTAWSKYVHASGRETVLYTNPVDAPSQRYTGITVANAPAIAQAFDRVSVFLWSRNKQRDLSESFRSQAEAYGTSPSKLMLVFELANTTLADARMINMLLTRGEAGALNFWRNHAAQGGSCDSETNRKIACAAFGKCVP